MSVGKFVRRKILVFDSQQNVVVGKFAVGKIASENLPSENLLSEKPPDTQTNVGWFESGEPISGVRSTGERDGYILKFSENSYFHR